jgi:hypothetical protein
MARRGLGSTPGHCSADHERLFSIVQVSSEATIAVTSWVVGSTW